MATSKQTFELVIESKFSSQILFGAVVSSYYDIMPVVCRAVSNVH